MGFFCWRRPSRPSRRSRRSRPSRPSRPMPFAAVSATGRVGDGCVTEGVGLRRRFGVQGPWLVEYEGRAGGPANSVHDVRGSGSGDMEASAIGEVLMIPFVNGRPGRGEGVIDFVGEKGESAIRPFSDE